MQDADERCECMVWRDGARRCELWMIDSKAVLRVYAGDDLVRQEQPPRERMYRRALELRDAPSSEE